MNRIFSGVLALMLLACVPSELSAQSHAQTARAFVQSPMALGMGDAGVAFSSQRTAFFYNPAHLAHVAPIRPHINFVGANLRLSTSTIDAISFVRDELQPAIEDGVFENPLRFREQQEIYTRAMDAGRNRSYAGADVLLPSVMMQVGGIGVGGGLFGSTLGRMQVTDGGAGVPRIDAAIQFDATGIASGALDFGTYGLPGLSVGASAKYQQRYLTVKNKDIDGFSEDEVFYLLEGTNVGFDLGALYDLDMIPVPGKFTVGFAAFDVVGSGFDYKFNGRTLYGEEANINEAEAEAEAAYANDRYKLSPSYRVGVAYTVPSLLGVFGETGVALDYVGYGDPMIPNQTTLAKLHLGAQAKVAGLLALRAGIAQGYTSLGAGLSLGPVKLDYAFYGTEEGREPGQLPSWNHVAQLSFGLF